MNRAALTLALACCACGPYVSSPTFPGTYSGTITETFSCANTTVPQFQLRETMDIVQHGVDLYVTLASCAGLTITAGASGDTASVDPTGRTSGSCVQIDPNGGTSITIDDFSGGTLVLSAGNNLAVNLSEDTTVNGDACTGVATGTLLLE